MDKEKYNKEMASGDKFQTYPRSQNYARKQEKWNSAFLQAQDMPNRERKRKNLLIFRPKTTVNSVDDKKEEWLINLGRRSNELEKSLETFPTLYLSYKTMGRET